jgi:hypothetical protein
MLLAIWLLFASPSFAVEMGTAFPQQFETLCHINREGIVTLLFRRDALHSELMTVTVTWTSGARSILILNPPRDPHVEAVLLELKDSQGKNLYLGLRSEPKGTFGYFAGGDGTPFPVACIP